MGWFESGKEPGVVIGDEPLDATDRYLKEVASLYEEQLHRRPTLDEVRRLLEIGLGVAGRQVLANFEEKDVSGITIKTAKKPKDQPYKAGDVFAIPLGDGRFAFGRVIGVAENNNLLIEVFRDVAESPRHGAAAVASGRLLPPIHMLSGNALKSWQWTVVGGNEGYRPSKEDLASEFARSDGITFHAVDWKGKVLRKIDEARAGKLPVADAGPQRVEMLIKEALGKKPNGGGAAGGAKAKAKPRSRG